MNNLGMVRPDMYRGGPSGPMRPPDFQPPTENPLPPAPSQPKKRRKTAASAANAAIQPTPPPTPADLLPPQPLSGYGDTLIASNPFDDTPSPSMNPMSHMGPHPHHMNMSPHHHPAHPPHHINHHPPPGMVGPNGPMRPMNPGMMMNPGGPMGPGGHMGNHMNHHMNNRGSSMSPMGGAPLGAMSPMGAMNPNLSPMGLQHGMNHGMNPQMGPGRPINSPMTPLGNSPMHSPLANCNGPMNPNGPVNRMNGMNPMNPQQSPHHQMGNPNSGPNSNLTPLNANNNSPTTALPSGTPNSNLNNSNNLPGSNNPNSMPVNSGGPSPMSNPNSMSNSPASMSMMSPMMVGPNGQMSGNQMNMANQGPPSGPMGNQMFSGPPKPMPVSAGKVYPVDTPMVFNPQNPNAPPIYPCGMCHKEVHDNDQGLLCESGCNFWFHRTCSGLTELAYQLIHSEVYAEWCCDKCMSSKNIPMVKFKP